MLEESIAQKSLEVAQIARELSPGQSRALVERIAGSLALASRDPLGKVGIGATCQAVDLTLDLAKIQSETLREAVKTSQVTDLVDQVHQQVWEAGQKLLAEKKSGKI